MIGRLLSNNQWNAFVLSLQNLFEATIPQSLIDEKEKYLESEIIKKQGDHHSSERVVDEDSAPVGKNGELPFNQDACFTKCIVQLLLISVTSETVEKFYD
jgi:hypothetical protein